MGCRLIAIAAAGASLFIGSLATAVDRTWFGGSGGFQSPSNWNPAGVPALTDRIFLESGAATVFSGFGISGGECSSAVLGDAPGSNASITVVSANPPTVGGGFRAAQDVIIGNRGTGAINVGGTRLSFSAQTVSLGAEPGGHGALSVSGSLFTRGTVSGDIYVGGSAAGPGGTGLVGASGGSQAGELYVGGTVVIYPGGTVRISGQNAGSFANVRQDGGFFQNDGQSTPGPGFVVPGTYELNGGSTELRNMTAGQMRVGGGFLGVASNSSVTGDLVVAPAAGQTMPAVFDLGGGGTLAIGGNLHVGGDAGGPIGPAILRSAAALSGAASRSVTIHPQGVLAETDPLSFSGGITNHGTVQPNEDEMGQLRIGSGGLRLAADGLLEISIHGINAADSVVSAGGGIQVDGLLFAYFAEPFSTNLGNSFLIISAPFTGRFDNPENVVIAGGRRLEIQYSVNQVRLIDIGAVPEPALSTAAIAMTLSARRRRQSKCDC